MSADVTALRALVGDRDDVRTILAWMMALNGRLNEIDRRAAAFDSHVDLARRFDGLDGHEVCSAMEKAFDELRLYEQALPDPSGAALSGGETDE